MDTLKCRIKKIKWTEVFYATEYIIAIYVILAAVLNLLMNVGVVIATGFLQPTFYGASQIAVILLQYGLISSNKQNKILLKMRPYVMGLAIAGILSSNDLTLGLLLLLLLGYFLMTGYGTKFNVKEAVFAALVACVGTEIYSVALLLSEGGSNAVSHGFMVSAWPDVLFVLTAIVYCVVNRDNEPAEVTEAVEQEKSKKRKFKVSDKYIAYIEKAKGYIAWLKENSKLVSRYIGGSVCVLAVALFLFYFVGTNAGANKIANSGEEVYLLQHCEDTSLVLTLVEDKVNQTYVVEFQEYTGANNQKVRIEDCDNGLYRLVFVEPELAMEMVLDETGTKLSIGINPVADNFEQYWVKEAYMPEQKMYKLLCAYGVPLCYQMLTQAKGIPAVMLQPGTDGYEFFTLSRTVADEFATEMVWNYGEEFTPTLLLETMLGYLGGWAFVPFVLVVVLLYAMIYARRVVGDKPAVLYAVCFAYMLTYASVGVIVLYLLAIGLLHVNAYLSKQAKHKQKAMVRYTGDMTAIVKDEVKESLDKMEAAVQEMREKLFAEINAMASEVVDRSHSDVTGEAPCEPEHEAERMEDVSELLGADTVEQRVEPDEDEIDELMELIGLAESVEVSESDAVDGEVTDENEGIEFEALSDEGNASEPDAMSGESHAADDGDELNMGEALEQSEDAEPMVKAEQRPVATQRSTANGKRKRNRKRR